MIRPAGATLALTVGLLAACSSSHPASPHFGDVLAAKVTVDAMFAHLRALQDIANAHKGNRAEGTPGFAASVDYVAKALRNKGFDVSTPQFDRLYTASAGQPRLTIADHDYAVDQASLLVQTPPGGITAPVMRPAKAAGCAVSDYAGAAPKGAIAVVDDSGCTVVDKQKAAAAKGAAALVVTSEPGHAGAPPKLFNPGYYDQLTMPVAVVGAEGAAALRDTTGPVRLTLDTATVKITSRNVLAQTKTGSAHDVVMVGAHLDSVPQGPGINDNATGVAAVLETALQLGSSPRLTNMVRFAFWGAEESGLNGSLDYVFGLGRDELNDVALYLNFDTLGSANAGFFTDDGDQSAPGGSGGAPQEVPTGSAGIERTLAGYLNLAGKRPFDLPLSTKSDYSPFLVAGVPIGGMTSGSSQTKTTVQARIWGGQAGVAFDPNYHSARDTLDNVNRDALAIMGSGVAFAVGTYAQSIDGVNGVPGHDQRHRKQVRP
ncbi:peptidase M28 [Mycobacterium heckeshornense]|uniref:Peptidase M28 n=1 Tax=Mycobacterium heckeshornense TaxID=110505 RepID=A0A2G8BJK7_9MYCO|nr:M20/M25/M40 family metallo-hydrolase [Mycobacterium heckeshornense]KMV24399.1 peptidase M28 [Mycobacterium heckeshornense]MCV7035455.1 M20/M25/M40 family metallo-hydrolase [Mycobacterium heckeshornense]PIJ37971.1 peptidase M28 [Mycobacterium heckeshornense]BCO37952.1 peptidase M28 [Mycobacterium heckeshornense]